MRFVYQARFEPADGEILVTVPDVPMVATFGKDEADAVASTADALATALLHHAKRGEPIPLPTTGAGPGLRPVALDLADALKLSVILAYRESGLSKTEFAARLGRVNSEAHRILDPDHATKLATLQAALAVLGRRAVLEVEAA
jgi:antitoxin HicB